MRPLAGEAHPSARRADAVEASISMSARRYVKRRMFVRPLNTSQASIQWIGPRKSILPISTPLWRRIA
jgi:hypothetical protein